ncbi:hypothetical protein SEMRO_914_G219630.1 [Seminavis robusta]|uniref:Uncharacterized protein n=1 Tax=Seminavis robusta TaxID=568900 RepID=A0A9N8EF98_9STRA|nr:hypothetical protein SEMRO_914_G219630.1 [Seminavis robusta]|eukprot:Sro914_g219630.1 n/a (165) ;mRNA; r:39098-39592
MVDIVVYGLPKSSNHLKKAHDETVVFCKRLELSEEFQHTVGTTLTQTVTKQSKSRKRKTYGQGSSCSGSGYTVSMVSVVTLPKTSGLIKQMVASAKTGKSFDKPKYGNKTWKGSADDAKKNSKKDLADFVTKSVQEALKNELNAIGIQEALFTAESNSSFFEHI